MPSSGGGDTQDDGLADTLPPGDDAALGATAAAPLIPDDQPTELIAVSASHYKVIAEHARGGLGRVLRARDQRTGRVVALKEVLRGGDEARARFAREALVTANLQHPAIIPVYEVGRWESGGEPFYAMKLVKGRSLEDVVRESRTLRDRLRLLPHVTHVAEALAYAHGERIIHRDLKPANVLVGAYGETVVIDWGLAKNLVTGDEAAALPAARPAAAAPATIGESLPVSQHGQTVAGAVLGTPSYMPPEQARGEAVDERSDVYAIGAMLYDVLSGVRPFAELTTPVLVLDALDEGRRPRPLAELEPELPGELLTIVEKAMAPRPEDRYATAAGLAEELQRFTTGQLVKAHHYSAWDLLRRWLRRHRAVVTAVAVALVVLGVFGVYSVRRIVRERNIAEAERALAQHRLSELFGEQGRQHLLSGETFQALAYLGESLRQGNDSPALRFLLGRALQPLATLEAVLPAHESSAVTAWFSPDGKQVLSAGLDFTVALWDVASHRRVAAVPGGLGAWYSPDGKTVVSVLAPHEILVWRGAGLVPAGRAALPGAAGTGSPDIPRLVSFSDDSSMYAVGGIGGSLSWWRTSDGMLAGSRHPHAGRVNSARFSPDGKLLLTCGDDGRAELFGVADGALVADDAHAGKPLRSAVFTPDGKTIVTAGDDGVPILWDAATGAERRRLAGSSGALAWAALSPDGSRLAAGGENGSTYVWDVASGALTATLAGHRNQVNAGAFSPDGTLLATGGEDASVRLWEVATGEPLALLTGHTAVLSTVAFSADGERLVTASFDHTVRIWRVAHGLPYRRLAGHSDTVMYGGDRPDGREVITASADTTARVWDAATGKVRLTLAGHSKGLMFAAWSPDGARIVTGGRDGTVRFWDAATGAPGLVLAGHTERVRTARFSHDGARIVSASFDGSARIWDVATGKQLLVLEGYGPVLTARFSPDDRRVVTTTEKAFVGLWDAATGKEIKGIGLIAADIFDADFSPDGSLLAVQPDTQEPHVYDGRTGDEKVTLIGHTLRPVTSVEFRPDGSQLLTSAADGTARIWAMPGGHLLTTLDHGAYVTTARYRPDGALIATAGMDHKIRVWDATGGRLLAVLDGFPYDIIKIHWAPDGQSLLVNGIGGEAWLFELPSFVGTTDELARLLACHLAVRVEGSGLVAQKPDPTGCPAK